MEKPRLFFLSDPKWSLSALHCGSAKTACPRAFVASLFFFLASCTLPAFADTFTGQVVGIADGDTITVMHQGRGERIRLWGIDCPEKAQAFGEKAKQVTAAHVFGKIVSVDVRDTDRYGRTVALVMLENGKSLNRELVEAGMCWWDKLHAPNDPQLAAAESNARARKLGLWAAPNPVPPWKWRHKKVTHGSPAARAGQGDIIGNRNSHIYHLPGCPGYGALKEKNEVYFESEEQAEHAGYRRAKNCVGASGEVEADLPEETPQSLD